MKRIIVRNAIGDQIQVAEMESTEAWLAEKVDSNFWGIPGDYTVEVVDLELDIQLAQCLAARKAEYPSADEFIHAFFDGGDSAIDTLRKMRAEIKAKYPKPTGES